MPEKKPIPGLAGRLKELREAAGLTQVQAAGRAGVGQGSIARFELEQRVPTLDMLYRLADAYGVNVCALLPGGKMPKPPRRRG